MPQLPRSLPSGGSQAGQGAFGRVPTVPDPFGTQGSAISGNMGNLSSLYGLTGSLNTNAAQQAALPFQLNLPNYQGMVGQSSQNIGSLLKGQVPQDVANQLSQMAAERGISTGSVGSPNANAALLRSLGLTSLGLQQQGEQNLTGAIARTPTGKQFSAQDFLVTPQQNQEAQYWANLLGAAPNPGAAQGAGLGAFRGGMGAVGGVGGAGGGGPTDLLGFTHGSMSGDQNFGPGPNAFWGRGGAGGGSDLIHSGGQFGASGQSGMMGGWGGAPAGTSTNPYTDQSVAPWATGGAQFPGMTMFGGQGAQGMQGAGAFPGAAPGSPEAGVGTGFGNPFQPGDFEFMFGDLGG